MKRILAAVLLLLASESSNATYIPAWFEPDQYFFSFEGGMGPGDIDRVTPIPHPELGGLTPGREWFAWIDVNSPGVAMSSWEGFEPGTDHHHFVGFIESDTSSSSQLYLFHSDWRWDMIRRVWARNLYVLSQRQGAWCERS